MLEYWFEDYRTLVDFQRGPLGPYFDGFAAHLKEAGYSMFRGRCILSRGRLFNGWLMDKGISRCNQISESHVESFLDEYVKRIRSTRRWSLQRRDARTNLKGLFSYLFELGVIKQPKPKREPRMEYSWMLDPFLKHLQEEYEITEKTIRASHKQARGFLESLGNNVTRKHMKALSAKTVEAYLRQHCEESRDKRKRLTAALRRFLRFCALKGYIATDFSDLIPSVRTYRRAALPRGMEDSALERVLDAIPKETAKGARDYAIILLMITYGVRGQSITELCLEDINWPRSTVRIRGKKGGKEVLLPLLDAVGEALLEYLRNRPTLPFREVFISTKAPLRPLGELGVCTMIQEYMRKAGVKRPRSGAGTLRHSWAIRALAHNTSIKAIADILGHRYVDTTFIYAKADLKTLRQAAMPWPEGR